MYQSGIFIVICSFADLQHRNGYFYHLRRTGTDQHPVFVTFYMQNTAYTGTIR